MFDKLKAKRAEREYEQALERWQEQVAWYQAMLETATDYKGTGSSELLLRSGEAVFYKVTGAGLIEERRARGHYAGGSTGVSFPVGSIGGRSVRYRVGANRGHYVQGAPVATAIDTGNVHITNHRVVFQGAKQTRECAFTKLIGFRHDDANGETSFSVSNRQKATTLHYGPELSGAFQFRLDLALAHYRGTVGELSQRLLREVKTIEGERPVPPLGAGDDGDDHRIADTRPPAQRREPALERDQQAGKPPQWQPHAGWGTVREYHRETRQDGHVIASCTFVPDDGSAPQVFELTDTAPPGLGEYARGTMQAGNFSMHASAEGMAKAESVFGDINEMDISDRKALFGHDPDVYAIYGWAWTPDYRLVKVAPGLLD